LPSSQPWQATLASLHFVLIKQQPTLH
jgi:hypothetical protein